VARLFPDYLDIEMKYVEDTGIYPIMHVIVFKREIVERNPWVAANLFKAFDEARRISVERALACTSSVLPLPWGYEFVKRMQAVVGDDLMPYGVEQNRTTLEAFLQYAFEQGVCHRKLTPEELFPPQVQKSFKV
jgi:4,5-dihydroxyphthalate decarboxylase